MPYPDASTTGVRTGVTLTNVSGDRNSNANGQIISALNVAGTVVINHDNVIVRDCRAREFIVNPGATGCVIEYCEAIGVTAGSTNSMDIEGDGATVRFCDISGSENGIWLEADDCVIEENFIHDLGKASSSDPHIDGIQIPGSNIGAAISSNNIIRHNTIDLNVQTATSCIITLDAENLIIEDNFFSGGAYVVYLLGNASATMTNNVFDEYAFGYLDAEGDGPFHFSGNTDAAGNLLSFNNETEEPPVADTITLTAVTIANPAMGTVSIVAGKLRYTPAAGYSGPANGTYTITDGAGQTSTAAWSGTVSAPPNPPPLAVADNNAFTVPFGTVNVDVNVLANDFADAP